MNHLDIQLLRGCAGLKWLSSRLPESISQENDTDTATIVCLCPDMVLQIEIAGSPLSSLSRGHGGNVIQWPAHLSKRGCIISTCALPALGMRHALLKASDMGAGSLKDQRHSRRWNHHSHHPQCGHHCGGHENCGCRHQPHPGERSLGCPLLC